MTIEIETSRLILRPLAPSDVDAHMAMMAEPEVAAFLSFSKKPEDRMARWRQFASYLGHWQIRGYGFFSVFEKSTGDWVGRAGPWQPETWPGLECGWGLSSRYWGRGYMPEAAIAAIRWTFLRFPDLPRIISMIDPDNRNSQAVAAKVGERLTDERFQLFDYSLQIWAADRDEWMSRFAPSAT